MGDFSSISRVGEGTGDFSGSELGPGCSDRARRQASLSIAGAAATPASTSRQWPDPHSGGLIISSRQRIGKGTGHSHCWRLRRLSLVTVPGGGGVDHPLSPLSSAAAVSQHHSSHDKGIHHINYQQNFWVLDCLYLVIRSLCPHPPGPGPHTSRPTTLLWLGGGASGPVDPETDPITSNQSGVSTKLSSIVLVWLMIVVWKEDYRNSNYIKNDILSINFPHN